MPNVTLSGLLGLGVGVAVGVGDGVAVGVGVGVGLAVGVVVAKRLLVGVRGVACVSVLGGDDIADAAQFLGAFEEDDLHGSFLLTSRDTAEGRSGGRA